MLVANVGRLTLHTADGPHIKQCHCSATLVTSGSQVTSLDLVSPFVKRVNDLPTRCLSSCKNTSAWHVPAEVQ